MAHARMAGAPERGAAGLGPLAAACALPQDGDTGCPLGDPFELPSIDVPASLVPWPTHADTDDVVAATTADAGWMVGAPRRAVKAAGGRGGVGSPARGLRRGGRPFFENDTHLHAATGHPAKP